MLRPMDVACVVNTVAIPGFMCLRYRRPIPVVFETKMLEDGFGGGVPGEIIPDKRRLLVRTADGALEIMSLQPAGKKRMDASAFLLGYSPARCEKSVL